MAISASVSAPAGDAPVRFPNTRAAKQAPLQKASERDGKEGTSSSLLQARCSRACALRCLRALRAHARGAGACAACKALNACVRLRTWAAR
jgi:hypothetical protein